MDIYVETLPPAPTQPRKGFIYGISKIIIHEHLWGQRIFPVGMMGKALAHIRHIE